MGGKLMKNKKQKYNENAPTKQRKTNHQTGWHKRVKNPTKNSKSITHKEFCEICYAYNKCCINTNTTRLDKNCSI